MNSNQGRIETSLYNVQCLSDHVFVASAGSELEQRCQEREQRGFLDALTVPGKECPVCQDEHDERDRRHAQYTRDWGEI